MTRTAVGTPSPPAPSHGDVTPPIERGSSSGPLPTRVAVGFSWLIGAAAVMGVAFAALHLAEERAFVEIVERAVPAWLLVATALQAATYAAEGQVWRLIARAVGVPLGFWDAYKLSLAKLFVSQALPSAGLSGTVVAARALSQRGFSRSTVMGGFVVDVASYYAAYVVSLGVAMVVSIARGHASAAILSIAAVVAAFAITMTVVLLVFAGREPPARLRKLVPFSLAERGLDLIRDADTNLTRDSRLLLRAGAFQMGIFLLDTMTMWFLILALGTVAPPTAVFASFMTSSVLRTIGILPGGLGTFEATSVFTLTLAGVPIAVALAATLAFRALSFWLPMIPGLIYSRVMTREPD